MKNWNQGAFVADPLRLNADEISLAEGFERAGGRVKAIFTNPDGTRLLYHSGPNGTNYTTELSPGKPDPSQVGKRTRSF